MENGCPRFFAPKLFTAAKNEKPEMVNNFPGSVRKKTVLADGSAESIVRSGLFGRRLDFRLGPGIPAFVARHTALFLFSFIILFAHK